MRFLYVAPRFHPNQYPIIEGLISKGHEVTFCVSRVGSIEKHGSVRMIVLNDSKLSNGLKAHYLKKGEIFAEDKMIFWFMPLKKQVDDILKSFRPDVVVLRERNMLSLVFYRACKHNNIGKVLLYNQSPVFYKKETLKRRVMKKIWFSFFPQKRITVCRYREYPVEDVKYYEDKDATFLPFVARTTTEIKSKFIENGILNVLDCGKYRPYKNHTVLVEAANEIVKNGKTNIHFTIVGQKENHQEQEYFQNLLKRIRELNLEDYFTLLGAVSYDEMQSLFLKNDVFVLTSIRELANVSILDAMSYGVPVIATNANGTSDYVTPGNNGYIFETGNSADLAEKLSIYYDSPKLLKEHSDHALESVKNNHSFETYYKGLSELLSTI